jgi:hypothetical protein
MTPSMPARYRGIASGVAIAIIVFVSGLPAAAAATDVQAPVTAGTTITVQRADNLNDFTVSWNSMGDQIKKYTVAVFADGTKATYTTKGTSLLVTGNTLQTVYRIEVAPSNATDGTTTITTVLPPALPGAPANPATSAAGATAGINISWLPPTRTGVDLIDHYRVQLTDQADHATLSQDVTSTSASFPTVDPRHLFEATITAVTKDGDGLPMDLTIGDVTSSAPRGFTSIREAQNPALVDLAWSKPVWQPFHPVTGYQVGTMVKSAIVWGPVTSLVPSLTVPLALSASQVYYVRAVNSAGASASVEADVYSVAQTQLPSSAAPVVLSSDGGELDVAFFNQLGSNPAAQLIVSAVSANGKFRYEKTVANGSDGVTFEDVTAAKYFVTVITHDPVTASETSVFSGYQVVPEDPTAVSSIDSSFDTGVGYWHGVYPSRHLPRVVATSDESFSGTGAMAITATYNSKNANVTVGTSGFGGIPVTTHQLVTVSALGKPAAASDWNMGISWWDASGNQISVVRAKRLTGVVGAWRPSQSTYVAPPTAVSATAFIEIGGLPKGGTFYVDSIALSTQ